MNATEAIVFINAIFSGNPDGEVEFLANAPDQLPSPILPGAFAVRITARARGEKAVSLCVFAFGPRDTESDQQSTITISTARIALELINVLERKIHEKKLRRPMETWYNNATVNFHTFRRPKFMTANNPEQLTEIIDELKRLGTEYESLMEERVDAETNNDQGAIEEIDEAIDEVLDQTMTAARRLSKLKGE